MKFVRVTRVWGKKNEYKEYYDGFIEKQTKEYIDFIGCGPEKDSQIKSHSFDVAEVRIKDIPQKTAEQFFKMAFLKHENEVNDAEFDLIDAKRGRDFALEQFKKAFKYPPSRES